MTCRPCSPPCTRTRVRAPLRRPSRPTPRRSRPTRRRLRAPDVPRNHDGDEGAARTRGPPPPATPGAPAFSGRSRPGTIRSKTRLPAGSPGVDPAPPGHRVPADLQRVELVPLRQPDLREPAAQLGRYTELHDDLQVVALGIGAGADAGVHRGDDRV